MNLVNNGIGSFFCVVITMETVNCGMDRVLLAAGNDVVVDNTIGSLDSFLCSTLQCWSRGISGGDQI